jgi:hypothetical protein
VSEKGAMDHFKAAKTTTLDRIGFHYFPDANHYREKDLSLWLPILKRIEAKTLVLVSPITRAIPEFFISALAQEKISIIIDFNLHGTEEGISSDLETLMIAYGKWGASYALLNKDVNCRESWSDSQWISNNPVQKSWSSWLVFSRLARDSGLKAVLPTMVPGGDFWDLVFLEQFFKLAVSKPGSGSLSNMVISALAWDWGHPLNWGSGGPERWAHVKPYHVPKGSQDQKGFHIFEWYASIATKMLGEIPPVMLFESGIVKRNTTDKSISQSPDQENRLLEITRLMAGENVYDPFAPNKLIDPVPLYVIANNFYLLCSEDSDPAANCRWFLPDGNPNSSASALLSWRKDQSFKDSDQRENSIVSINEKRSFSSGRYILLPHDLFDKLPELQVRLSQYIDRYKPQVGFSVQHAMQSAYILVVGENDNFSYCDLDKLKQNGSLVKTINFNELESLSV